MEEINNNLPLVAVARFSCKTAKKAILGAKSGIPKSN